MIRSSYSFLFFESRNRNGENRKPKQKKRKRRWDTRKGKEKTRKAGEKTKKRKAPLLRFHDTPLRVSLKFYFGFRFCFLPGRTPCNLQNFPFPGYPAAAAADPASLALDPAGSCGRGHGLFELLSLHTRPAICPIRLFRIQGVPALPVWCFEILTRA